MPVAGAVRPNSDVARVFNAIADLLEIEGANTFRIRAYRSAARMLTELGTRTDKINLGATSIEVARPGFDRFFDDVMVMADDPGVRANRLALLSDVARTMNKVADISKLAA